MLEGMPILRSGGVGPPVDKRRPEPVQLGVLISDVTSRWVVL